MEIFRTPILPVPGKAITHAQPFISLGSCFADSIGQRLLANKWNGLANPFGTLFHPLAIFNILSPSHELADDLFVESTTPALHYRLPKTFSALTRTDLQNRYSESHRELHSTLKRPGAILFLTLGTAFVYQHAESWVANCHQQPSRLFTKKLSAIPELLQAWRQTFAHLPKTCRVMITVSPVRHLKEGLVESSLSKSILRVLAEEMVQSAPDRIEYFPAYELMMDDLRDYRFYQPDMLHPTEQAIDYIWDKFQSSYMGLSTRELNTRWQKLLSRINHRPLHPEAQSYRAFLEKLLVDLKDVSEFSVHDEISKIEERLSAL